MRLSSAWPLSLCLGLAYGFRDTSPFFAFSTLDRDFSSPIHDSTIKTAALSFLIKEITRQCHTDNYVLVSQPGVSADDYSNTDAAPSLHRRLQAARARNSTIIKPDVLGHLTQEDTLGELATTCGMTGHKIKVHDRPIELPAVIPQIIFVELPELSRDDRRRQQLRDNDYALNAVLEALHDRSYTVLFSTTPLSSVQHSDTGSVDAHLSQHKHAPQKSEDTPDSSQQHTPHLYDYDSEDALPEAYHSDLKRDLDSHVKRQSRNSSRRNAPLFESYNFLSPGIFMGLLATFLLSSILYIGVTAIAGLEVTYGAFSKEMGPAGQKKQ